MITTAMTVTMMTVVMNSSSSPDCVSPLASTKLTLSMVTSLGMPSHSQTAQTRAGSNVGIVYPRRGVIDGCSWQEGWGYHQIPQGHYTVHITKSIPCLEDMTWRDCTPCCCEGSVATQLCRACSTTKLRVTPQAWPSEYVFVYWLTSDLCEPLNAQHWTNSILYKALRMPVQ